MNFFRTYIGIIILLSILVSNTNSQKIYEGLIYNYNNKIIDEQNNIPKYKKDQLIAFGLSALLSGAGQFYLGKWKKGLIYTSVEILEWAVRDDYLKKNRYYIDLYKEYASNHWDAKKWMRDYFLYNNEHSIVYEAFLNPENLYTNPWDNAHGFIFEYCEIPNSNGCNNGTLISTSENGFEDIYEDICDDGYSINGCNFNQDSLEVKLGSSLEDLNNDNQIDVLDAISTYVGDVLQNHHLYEGIGKYNVYFSGWEDATFSHVDSVDNSSWIEVEPNGYKIATTNFKKIYEHTLRANAKAKSDVAENALTAVFINHAVSMIDALINKNNRKNQIHLSTYYDSRNALGIGGIKIRIGIK